MWVLGIALAFLVHVRDSHASTVCSTETELRAAMDSLPLSSPLHITLAADVQLSCPLIVHEGNATLDGGGYSLSGGDATPIAIVLRANFTLVNTVLEQCYGAVGACVFASNSSVEMRKVDVIGSSAAFGAIAAIHSTLRFETVSVAAAATNFSVTALYPSHCSVANVSAATEAMQSIASGTSVFASKLGSEAGGFLVALHSIVESSSLEVLGANTGGSGGAILAVSSTLVLQNTRFEHCRADSGGAVYFTQLTSYYISMDASFTCERCTFLNNSAQVDGGAVYVGGPKPNFYSLNSSFYYNNAWSGFGGGVYFTGEDGHMNQTHFEANGAVRGGAVSVSSAAAFIVDEGACINNYGNIGCCFYLDTASKDSVEINHFTFFGNYYWALDEGLSGKGTDVFVTSTPISVYKSEMLTDTSWDSPEVRFYSSSSEIDFYFSTIVLSDASPWFSYFVNQPGDYSVQFDTCVINSTGTVGTVLAEGIGSSSRIILRNVIADPALNISQFSQISVVSCATLNSLSLDTVCPNEYCSDLPEGLSCLCEDGWSDPIYDGCITQPLIYLPVRTLYTSVTKPDKLSLEVVFTNQGDETLFWNVSAVESTANFSWVITPQSNSTQGCTLSIVALIANSTGVQGNQRYSTRFRVDSNSKPVSDEQVFVNVTVLITASLDLRHSILVGNTSTQAGEAYSFELEPRDIEGLPIVSAGSDLITASMATQLGISVPCENTYSSTRAVYVGTCKVPYYVAGNLTLQITDNDYELALNVSCQCVAPFISSGAQCICPAGSYLDGSSCKTCPIDTYNPEKGATSITQCFSCDDVLRSSVTTDVGSDSTSACRCPVGMYQREDKYGECASCLSGASCTEVGITVKRLPLSEGYYRISDTSESVLTCQVQDSCVGGNDTAAYCGEGYRGVMCASCEKGYFQTFGNVCVQCTQTKKLLGASPLLIILGIVVLFAVVQLPGYMGFDIAANVQGLTGSIQGLMQGAASLSAPVKAVSHHLQIVGRFKDTFNISVGTNFNVAAGYLNIFNLDIGSFLPMHCWGYDYFTIYFFDMLWPVTLLSITLLVGLLLPKYRTLCLTSCIGLVYVIYASVSMDAVGYFQCVKFDDGSTWIGYDYSISCNSEKYKTYMPYAVFFLILYPIGIPVALLLTLTCIVRNAKNSASTRALGNFKSERRLGLKDQDETVATYQLRFLFNDYKAEFWYWEIVECLKKTALLGGVMLVNRGSMSQVAIGLVVGLFSYAMYSYCSPHKNAGVLRFNNICQIMIVFTLIGGLLVRVAMLQKDSNQRRMLSTVMMAISFVPIACLFISIFFSSGDMAEKLQVAKEKAKSPISRSHSPISRSHSPISRSDSPISPSHSPISRSHSPISRLHSPSSPQDSKRGLRIQIPSPTCEATPSVCISNYQLSPKIIALYHVRHSTPSEHSSL